MHTGLSAYGSLKYKRHKEKKLDVVSWKSGYLIEESRHGHNMQSAM